MYEYSCNPCFNIPTSTLCFSGTSSKQSSSVPSSFFSQRLLDFEKYLSGNELQIGGFDLLYKERNVYGLETWVGDGPMVGGDLGESRGHGPWIFIMEVLGCFVGCMLDALFFCVWVCELIPILLTKIGRVKILHMIILLQYVFPTSLKLQHGFFWFLAKKMESQMI